jgi:hypothetical protein
MAQICEWEKKPDNGMLPFCIEIIIFDKGHRVRGTPVFFRGSRQVGANGCGCKVDAERMKRRSAGPFVHCLGTYDEFKSPYVPSLNII